MPVPVLQELRDNFVLILTAGCDIIDTSSYQASLAGFAEHLNLDQAEGKKLLRASVTLAKEAVKTFMDKCKQLITLEANKIQFQSFVNSNAFICQATLQELH